MQLTVIGYEAGAALFALCRESLINACHKCHPTAFLEGANTGS